MAQAGYRDALGAHARRLAQSTIQDLNRRQPGRAQQLALRVGPLYANFARQSYDQPALDALWAYGQSLELPQAFRRLFDGAPVNLTEARPALHTALRSDLGRGPVAAGGGRDERQAGKQEWTNEEPEAHVGASLLQARQ